MGNGMNKIIPGLYVGNYRDSGEESQLKENKITHILSVHDNAKPIRSDMIYLCISAQDVGTQDLASHFAQCNDFIHSARIYGGNVLVHCLAGMSRSVTITVAYLMTVTDLGWRDGLNVVRAARQVASPNYGFQKQLLTFQHEGVAQERRRLFTMYPKYERRAEDKTAVKALLVLHARWVAEGDRVRESAESDTYQLPHRAYEHPLQAAKRDEQKIEKSDTSAGENLLVGGSQKIVETSKTSATTTSNSGNDQHLLNEIFGPTISETLKDSTSDMQSKASTNGAEFDCDEKQSNMCGTTNEIQSSVSNQVRSLEPANQDRASQQVTLDDLFADPGRKKSSL